MWWWGFRWGRFQTHQIEYEKCVKGLDYDEREVRLATVHTRQDVSGLCHMCAGA
jgi:hypothetical protein